jgi:predicted outer membrane repeat protein
MFLLHSITAWNDYFPGITLINLNSQTYTSRQTPSDTYIYVLNCLFNSITSTGNGGALYCTSTYLLVESTSFFSCKTSGGNAGAIFFQNTNSGQCVLHEVCGYDCCKTDSITCQFDCIYPKNDISSKNYINYSSISRCVNVNSGHTLYHYNGKICFQSVNISNNKCWGNSFFCYPFLDSNSFTCSFSYSSFADNVATNYAWLKLYTPGAKYEIKNCNILRNSQVTVSSYGIISTWGNLKIDDSCILDNKATLTFYQDSSSYRITLSNCTVDSTSNNGYLIIQSTATKSFIFALNHMSTQNCHAGYDVVGYLTPITPPSLFSNKQKYCYTGQKYLLQLRNEDVVSLISILIFNFIHLEASLGPFY